MATYDLGHTGFVRIIRAAYRLFDVGSIGLLRMTGEEIAENTDGGDFEHPNENDDDGGWEIVDTMTKEVE